MPTTDFAVLSDFNYQDEGWQAELQAELVDRIAAFSSGILTETSVLSSGEPGAFVNITQYPTVSDEPEQVVSGQDANIYDFSDYKQRAVWVLRELAFGVENLVQIMAKKDPHAEIMRQATNIWAKAIQKSAISQVKGVMGGALSASHSTGAAYIGNKITDEAFMEAKQLLGDAKAQLTRAIAHSRVLTDAGAYLKNNFSGINLAGTIVTTGNVPTLFGTNVFEDDAVAAVGGVFSTYIAAPGAIGYKLSPWTRRDYNGKMVSSPSVDFEFQRIARTGGGQDVLYMRAKYLVHVFGTSYTSATSNPTDAQLATDTNYAKVADDNRKIKIVELKTA